MRIRPSARSLAWLLAAAVLAPRAHAASPVPPPPPTPQHPVTDHYDHIAVVDPYRWLENWSDPAVKAWSTAQNAHTREYLDRLPMRAEVLHRIEQLTHSASPQYYDLRHTAAGIFAMKNQPPRQQPLLVRLESVAPLGREHVVVDPNLLDPSGSTAIDFYTPTPDGRLVAVSLSKGGSESGTVHVFDGLTGHERADQVPRVQGGTAGGSVAWNEEGTGFYHTRYPAPGERPEADLPFWQQVWFHRLGTPAGEDAYVVGRSFPKIAEIQLSQSEDGRWVLADVLNGDGGEHAIWVAPAGGEATGPSAFHAVTGFVDSVVFARAAGDRLFMLSRRGHPNGRIVSVSLESLDLPDAREVMPEPRDAAIEWFVPTAHELLVEEIVGGPSRVVRIAQDGRPLGALPVAEVSMVGAIVHTRDDDALIQHETFTEPSRWSAWSPARGGALEPTALAVRSPAHFDDVEVRREFAVSRDGTRVPLNIIMRRGTRLDGTAPTLLTGYGGYGISQRPGFSALRRMWLDQGGIIAIANTRGGGEFGDAWHRAGNLTRKQNVFDDFAACGRYLVSRHYTSPAHLAASGASNGGLLMGAMIAQHPELFRAVASGVGIYDMLRVELSPNGGFNVTEFGTVRNPAQLRALYAYSPYHHVKDRVAYPAVLFYTGANDPRVDPMNSRKMAARLQAATSSGRPILLRTSSNTGHGIGSPLSARDALSADMYTFLFDQLGVPFHEPLLAKPSLKRATEGPRTRRRT
ncbi:MAG TPA: prolyl oligopeptidase family serine peptidase [Candidatus Eisenbacteria bacterium]|nr:prolyl oligopeptidase family serine peptidase [Candidatus Eisenbacteria bacterium]